MKKILFVLTVVFVACELFHATADPVYSGLAASPPVLTATTTAPATDASPTLKVSESDADTRVVLAANPDSQPAPAARSNETSGHLGALVGFLQSTGDAIPDQANPQSTALSISAHWGVVLIGVSALYMLTLRRNRDSRF